MKLPNIDKAVIEQGKIRDYLLSETHPVGRFKAQFFAALGFSRNNWPALHSEIEGMLKQDASHRETTQFGDKFEIRGLIAGPSGKSAIIISAWIILKDENFPRFVTAYPGDE